MKDVDDADSCHGWISDPDLAWFNAWLPKVPMVPFPEWLEWIREHVPNLEEISEFRVRRGPDPQMWMFQVGYRNAPSSRSLPDAPTADTDDAKPAAP